MNFKTGALPCRRPPVHNPRTRVAWSAGNWQHVSLSCENLKIQKVKLLSKSSKKLNFSSLVDTLPTSQALLSSRSMARWPQGALHLPQQLLHQVRRCLSLLQARSMLIKINDKIYSSLSFPSSLLALHETVIWTTPHLSAGGNKRWRSANIRSVRPLWNIAFKRAAPIFPFL